eukprot:1159563-Pelagomonas_calceolata.AAC.1
MGECMGVLKGCPNLVPFDTFDLSSRLSVDIYKFGLVTDTFCFSYAAPAGRHVLLQLSCPRRQAPTSSHHQGQAWGTTGNPTDPH